MMKKLPEIEYLKLDINGDPGLLEEVTELDALYAASDTRLNCRLEWLFKVFDFTDKNRLLVESLIHHDHQLVRFKEVPLPDLELMIKSSFEECSNVLQRELKFNEVSHRPKPLAGEEISRLASTLYERLKKRLF